MSKGDYSHNYEPDKLRRLIQEGWTAKEIADELSVSFYSLREHLEMLKQEDKKQYEIPGLYESQEAADKLIKKRRGRICSFESRYVPNFKPGDAFEMMARSGRIILKKINKKR